MVARQIDVLVDPAIQVSLVEGHPPHPVRSLVFRHQIGQPRALVLERRSRRRFHHHLRPDYRHHALEVVPVRSARREVRFLVRADRLHFHNHARTQRRQRRLVHPVVGVRPVSLVLGRYVRHRFLVQFRHAPVWLDHARPDLRRVLIEGLPFHRSLRPTLHPRRRLNPVHHPVRIRQPPRRIQREVFFLVQNRRGGELLRRNLCRRGLDCLGRRAERRAIQRPCGNLRPHQGRGGSQAEENNGNTKRRANGTAGNHGKEPCGWICGYARTISTAPAQINHFHGSFAASLERARLHSVRKTQFSGRQPLHRPVRLCNSGALVREGSLAPPVSAVHFLELRMPQSCV